MECNKAKCGKEFHVSHLCALQSKYLDRLHVLRKGPRLPRLTVDCWVPTSIKHHDCSSLLNGKRPAKKRETKIWLIIVHSVNNFARSELPAWKSNMAGKENGKRRKSWVKLRTVLYNSTNALTLSSKSMTKPQPRTQICTKHIWYWFYEFGSKRSSSNHTVQSWHTVWILFVMVWADFSPKYLLSSHSSVYFNKLHSNTSSGSAHSKSKSQTKSIRTTWNSIDPNGYSMGSKSNVQTSWNSSNNTRRCMLWGRRKQEENLSLLVETIKIWFHILYQRCAIHLN